MGQREVHREAEGTPGQEVRVAFVSVLSQDVEQLFTSVSKISANERESNSYQELPEYSGCWAVAQP